MEIEFSQLNLLLLIFVRMSAMILLNPLFSKRHVPAQVKIGLALILSLLMSSVTDAASVTYDSGSDIVFAMIREVFVGYVCGFVFQIYYYLLFFAGDLMDLQFGLSMAKVFDPSTSIQMSVSSNLLSLLMVLYIFATDSHLLMIKIFATSFQIIPVGAASLSLGISGFVLDLMIDGFVLALKLALPFIAAEFTIDASMGILMKIIPQIHVFVINIQMKLLLGILLLLLFAHPISGFIDHYMADMFLSMEKALYQLAAY